MKSNILLCFLCLNLCVFCFGQIEHGGTPYSFRKSNLAYSEIPTMYLPPMDNQQLLEKEMNVSIDNVHKTGYQFGVEIPVDFSLENSGLWEILGNGDRLWRLKVKSTDALSLNLIFDEFFIPEHSKLFIYTADKSYVTGAFTHENNQPSGIFSTALYPSDEIVLEYYESAMDKDLSKIRLTTVVHAYKDLLGKSGTYGSSGSCNININCQLGANYQDIKRAVALILNGSSAHCSGTLLNNVRQDGKPFFLTANHCISYSSIVSRFVFVFNYESEGCAGRNEKQTYSINGSTLLARDVYSDFCLLLLNDTPTQEMTPYYAGWDASVAQPIGAVGIHHPSGDLKKISMTNSRLKYAKYEEDDSSFPDSTHWKLVWNQGTTEGGSSGSALFNLSKRVVGQLEGGWASCSNQEGEDYYGRIAYSWTNANSRYSSKRLDVWLDPDKTGQLVIDGYDPFETAIAEQQDNRESFCSLYPNPAKDMVNIFSQVQEFEYEIYNINAQKLLQGVVNDGKESLFLQSFANGIYFVRITSVQGVQMLKFIIQR
ncbi:MAG: T9SS type A sorting domain-containing protein [Bacteroidales bacterium]|nr:T9SS type A sorting domain-containing protein [Bacteroidales bacterium]